MTHDQAIQHVLTAIQDAARNMGFEPSSDAISNITQWLDAFFPEHPNGPSRAIVADTVETLERILRLRVRRHYIDLTTQELVNPDAEGTRNAILRLYYRDRLSEVNNDLLKFHAE